MLRQQESLAMGAQTGKCVFAPLQEPLKQWLPPEKEKKNSSTYSHFPLFTLKHTKERVTALCVPLWYCQGYRKRMFLLANKVDGNAMVMKPPVTPFTCLLYSAEEFEHLCFQCQKAQMLCCSCIIWALKLPVDTVSCIRSLIIQLARVC